MVPSSPPLVRRALRLRLVGALDTAFFGCFSFLVALLGSVVLFTLAISLARYYWLNVHGFETLGFSAIFVLLTAFLMWRTVFVYVEVGADGVVVRRRLRRQFIPYADITGVHHRGTMQGQSIVVLELRDGTQATFRVDTLSIKRQRMLMDRLAEERWAHGDAARRGDALAELDRGERSVVEWEEALRKRVAQGDIYRRARLTPEDVARTLENAAAPPERRLGAAMALAATGEPDAAVRIRVAAGASADARLRIALQSIADGELDEEAVDEAAREAPEARRAQAG